MYECCRCINRSGCINNASLEVDAFTIVVAVVVVAVVVVMRVERVEKVERVVGSAVVGMVFVAFAVHVLLPGGQGNMFMPSQ
jgi:hypothetical protein